MTSIKRLQPGDDNLQRRNLRVGLALAAVALALFVGFILRAWLLKV